MNQRIYVNCFMFGYFMSTNPASDARTNRSRLIDWVASSHRPVHVKGERNGAALIPEEDWQANQKTLFLLLVPGMRESTRKGVETPVDECVDDLHS